LGNVAFVCDPETKDANAIANVPVSTIISNILGIESASLEIPLIKRSSFIRGERIFTPLTETQVFIYLLFIYFLLSNFSDNFIRQKIQETHCQKLCMDNFLIS